MSVAVMRQLAALRTCQAARACREAEARLAELESDAVQWGASMDALQLAAARTHWRQIRSARAAREAALAHWKRCVRREAAWQWLEHG